MDIGILIAVCVLFSVMGILMLIGKGDFMINCLRKPGAEKYNVWRVRLIHALSMFFGVGIVLVAHLLKNSSLAPKIILPLTGLWVVTIIVLNYTWAKRK